MAKANKNFIGHLGDWLTWPRFIFSITMFFFLTSILFPFYWMVSSSFKNRAEIAGRAPVYIPGALRLEAYQELFSPAHEAFQNFGINILNTLKVALPTAIIAVILSTLGAYAIARLRFKGKNFLLNLTAPIFMLSAKIISPLSPSKNSVLPPPISTQSIRFFLTFRAISTPR